MTPKGQKVNPKSLPKDFIEALRDLGGGIASDIGDQTGLRPKKISQPSFPEEMFSLEGKNQETAKIFERRLYRAEVLRKQEKLIFSSRDQETKTKVFALQQEVQKLALATNSLAKEAKVAAFSVPSQPGIYHETFFEKLISFIKSLTKKVENASVWLAAWNARSKKKPFYWAQVGKSGSKFMLSPDRYMSTQAG
jgi:hypothetical protein